MASNAQTQWKIAYRGWKKEIQESSAFYESDEAAERMYRSRREAALERIIEAQARRIAELEADLARRSYLLNMANHSNWKERA